MYNVSSTRIHKSYAPSLLYSTNQDIRNILYHRCHALGLQIFGITLGEIWMNYLMVELIKALSNYCHFTVCTILFYVINLRNTAHIVSLLICSIQIKIHWKHRSHRVKWKIRHQQSWETFPFPFFVFTNTDPMLRARLLSKK